MIVNSAEFLKSSTGVSHCPPDQKPEYAFIGRSNVGKSSLINKLCNKSKLAKTSSTPGKTQLINHFLVNENWYLVDLPGYGFAKMPIAVRKKMEAMISEYLLGRKNLMNIYVLIDSRHQPLAIDMEFMEQLAENQLAFSIIFTKADKSKKRKLEDNIAKYKSKLSEAWEVLPPMFLTSSESGLGADLILKDIESINTLFHVD
ncbi:MULTISPECIES: ribosome biogenesis GTP-binding protein YihA/YsxC [unclassified Lentimicrobium]|uniref:ribosome biogenesis GTP-binding protein YihA/YsxC n=1 Tax=unclassified Lentimicrobium TaxID=2677434 RepID=UPI00155628A9|nr:MULTISPECIES: ribosome biogenesis GTP-binding protein YihA/YsxC [unclassified Lentimicrobium]NPD44330.1 YihA family ribosome biogenesis GTP-binding protein [Lentimicrobium sp. S6]NPD84565.1 YihA family ribosome biogenesis GTP-binding protein [Lentimicrobium sp. L6]